MKRSRTKIRIEAVWRRIILGLPIYGHSRLILLTEYPKSGGTWVGQMLAACLNMPFPRHQFPLRTPCIMHGHYLRHYFAPRKLVLWRDPRDIMVSWYYHCLFPSEFSNRQLVEHTKAELGFSNYDDVRENLAKFIEYAFERQRSPGFNWSHFFDSWHDQSSAVHTSYESFRENPVHELLRVSEALGFVCSNELAWQAVEQFSFQRLTGREPGHEERGKFVRKGIVGDWKNQFTIEAAQIFDHYVGERLYQGGFETDRDWLKRIGV